MTSDEFVKGKIAEAAWQAAGHISLQSCLAVMFILRTRTGENGNWLDTIRKMPEPEETREIDPRNPEFLRVLELVDSVYDGTRTDRLTQGGLYWSADGLSGAETLMHSKERVADVSGLIIWK